MGFGKDTVSFGRRRQVQAYQQNQLQKCMLLHLGFCFISGCCLCTPKQNAKVKWNGSPSSMGTEAYDRMKKSK